MLQPHSQEHRGYFEAFKRRSTTLSSAAAADVLNKDEILTDRGAYLSFLEVQLERVSRACVATQEFDRRIDVFAAKAAAAEQKVCLSSKRGITDLYVNSRHVYISIQSVPCTNTQSTTLHGFPVVVCYPTTV